MLDVLVWPTSAHVMLETALISLLIYLFVFHLRKRRNNGTQLTERQKDELINEWRPDSLVPDTPENHPALHPIFIDGKLGKWVKLNGVECLNLASTNYLGFVGDARIEAPSMCIWNWRMNWPIFSVVKRPCCTASAFRPSPAPFRHMQNEAISSSWIRVDCNFRLPIIVGVNFAIQKGLQASRSRIEWFEHNNVADLERLMLLQDEKDGRDPKKAATIRRFLVVEGLYANTGDICPLPELMKLKWRFKVRIFLDESHSFGVLGDSGKGVTEHFNVDLADVDMVMASLENAIASTGGFCAGRSFVVAHQRLAGLGYCFSASLPPLLTTAANEAVRIMRQEPDRFERLHENSRLTRQLLMEAIEGTEWSIGGCEQSPMVHIYWGKEEKEAWKDAEERLDRFVLDALDLGLLLTRARYLDCEEMFPVRPSVRLVLNSELSQQEIENAVDKLNKLFHQIQ